MLGWRWLCGVGCGVLSDESIFERCDRQAFVGPEGREIFLEAAEVVWPVNRAA